MRTSPYPIKHGVKWVTRVHRRLKHAHHRMWAIALWDNDQLRGIALVGAPHARKLGVDQGTEPWPPPYDVLEVVRVAVEEGTPNGCSKLYGACSRAGRAMGALDMLTYTDEDEPGTSLRAAGWIEDVGLFGGGQASRPSRPRRERSTQEAQKRRRWWAPWSRSAPQRGMVEQGVGRRGNRRGNPPSCSACNDVGSYVSLPGDVISPCPYCTEKDSTRLTAEAVDSVSCNDGDLRENREQS